MTPSLLREAGEALWGHLWQTELSRALGVSDRTVRRWMASVNEIPDGVRAELQDILRERGKLLLHLIPRLG